MSTVRTPASEADFMSRSEQKVVQYLNEAHATEVALVRAVSPQLYAEYAAAMTMIWLQTRASRARSSRSRSSVVAPSAAR